MADSHILSVRKVAKIKKRMFARKLRNDATLTERRLWKELRCKRLGVKIRRQFVIRGYIVDFYVGQARLAIEVDGAGHEDPKIKTYDAARSAHIGAAGVRVLRFKNAEVWEDISSVISTIKKAANLA